MTGKRNILLGEILKLNFANEDFSGAPVNFTARANEFLLAVNAASTRFQHPLPLADASVFIKALSLKRPLAPWSGIRDQVETPASKIAIH